jgi:hypothetical protein
MKRGRLLLIILALLTVVVITRLPFRRWAHFSSNPVGSPASENRAAGRKNVESVKGSTNLEAAGANLTERDKENMAKIGAAFSAPISFYGRVVDQFGKPVPGAKVYYSAADQYFGKSSKYEGGADANGVFSITGIKGAGLYVEVSKPGYDRIAEKSYGSFGYGVPTSNPRPSKNDPAMFILRKKDEGEPLITIDRDFIIPMDGRTVAVSLRSGKSVSAGDGDLLIECWADDQNRDDRGHYDWHFRLTIPGGGLVHRDSGSITFDAPLDGYEPFKDFQMPKNALRWKDSFDENFFVNVRDGTYARLRFRITTGGDHFASVTSYLNPSGSRNLEFDAAKQIKAK